MITLTKRLRAEATSASMGRVSIRDKLLVKEVQEMESTLPAGCKVKFEDPNALHDFTLVRIVFLPLNCYYCFLIFFCFF